MNNSEKVSPPSKPDISEEMVSRWQTIANLMARIVGVPAVSKSVIRGEKLAKAEKYTLIE